jgi:hypothetical protein
MRARERGYLCPHKDFGICVNYYLKDTQRAEIPDQVSPPVAGPYDSNGGICYFLFHSCLSIFFIHRLPQ